MLGIVLIYIRGALDFAEKIDFWVIVFLAYKNGG
jgi:hypothetical protein